MNSYDITHSCGHSATHKLTGPGKDRDRRRAWLAGQPCPECSARLRATAYIIEKLQPYLELARSGRNPGPWWRWVIANGHEQIAAMVNLRDVDAEVELAFGVARARAWQARVAAHSGEATAPPEGWTIWADDDYCYAQAPGVQVLPDTPRGIGDGFKRGNQWRVDLRTGDVECRSVSGIGGYAAWNMWYRDQAPEWLLVTATAMARQRDAEHAGMLTCAMTYLHVHASGARLMPTPEAVHGVRVLPVADDAAEQVAHAIAAGDIDGAIHAAAAAKAKPKKETP